MRLDSPLTCISFLERVHRLGAVCVYGPGVSSLSLSLSLNLSLRRRAIRRYTTVIVSCSPLLARECCVRIYVWRGGGECATRVGACHLCLSPSDQGAKERGIHKVDILGCNL